MSRGQQDYGLYAPKRAVSSLSDLGELAARLGSIVTYDRRGEVVYLDDFESPVLRWTSLTGGATSYVQHSNNFFRSGCQSCRLHVDSVVDSYAGLYRLMQVANSARLGVEMTFSNSSTYSHLRLQLQPVVNSLRCYCTVKIDFLTKKLYVLNASNAYTEVADLPFWASSIGTFHIIKVVVDFEALKYVRLLLEGTEYDISAVGIYTLPDPLARNVAQQILATSQGTQSQDVYIDDFIVTQEEP